MVLKKAQPDQRGLLLANLLDDDLVGRFGIGLVEHHALVAGALEHRRERHDADRRKPHDADIAVGGARRCRQRIELWIADVDQEDTHEMQPINAEGSLQSNFINYCDPF